MSSNLKDFQQKFMRHWHVGNNLPGCLPTSDGPALYFSSWDDAWQYLLADLEDLWDEDNETLSLSQAIDDVYDVCLAQREDNIHVEVNGRIYWLEECFEPCKKEE